MIILLFLLFLLFIVPIAVCIFMTVSLWKVFKKAGQGGWEAIVPIYNSVVLVKISGLSMWYLLLLFLPVANIYAQVMIYLELSKKFKQSTEFAIGLIFLYPIFLGILAFDKKIEYSSQSMYCGCCGNKINPDDIFCINCGCKIGESKQVCQYCKSELTKGDKFCSCCGKSVNL